MLAPPAPKEDSHSPISALPFYSGVRGRLLYLNPLFFWALPATERWNLIILARYMQSSTDAGVPDHQHSPRFRLGFAGDLTTRLCPKIRCEAHYVTVQARSKRLRNRRSQMLMT